MTDTKPRLVIATDNFLPRWDGIARFLSSTLESLSEHFDITVIAPQFGPVEHEGYVLIQIPLRKYVIGDLRFAKFAFRKIGKEIKKADIVFTQTIGPIGASAILSAKKQKKPLVSYIHSLEAELLPKAMKPTPMRTRLYSFMRWYTRFLYNRCDLLLVPSEHVDDQLSWQGITRRKKVVRLGVDTKRFSPGTAKTMRTKLGIGEEEVVIGQHGRLAREKDIKTLARAFFRIHKKYEHTKLLLVADGIPEISEMLRDKEGVVLVPAQSDIVPYLRSMNMYVLSSLTETTSLATLEALACALPVISTPVGFVHDYITDGKNGLFFPFKDAFKLSAHIEWVMKHPTLAARMGEAGRELVEKEFSWDTTVQGIQEALQEAMEKKSLR